MKLCKSCPFSRRALPGLWHPAHYIAIAYLGSAEHPALIGAVMGCHQWNGIVHPARSPQDSPVCGGWLRAARDTSMALRVSLAMGGGPEASEAWDGEDVLGLEEMARRQGVNVDALPPLKWTPEARERWGDPDEWGRTLITERQRMLEEPEYARRYVVPGSPLDVGVTYEEVCDAMGEDVADRYFE